MSITIRAVVEDGRLRPLEPIDLIEGQEIEIIITDNAVTALDNQLSLFSSEDN